MHEKTRRVSGLAEVIRPDRWTFLVFDREASDQLERLVHDLTRQVAPPWQFESGALPPGWVKGIRGCWLFALQKEQFPRDLLVPLLRKHLGYEAPDATADLFTLGIFQGEDDILSAARK
jgi:hypothetical protein